MLLFARRRLSSISAEEVKKFSASSHEWWSKSGQYTILHRMNPTRVQYMTSNLPSKSFANLSVLDIGCGGGLLSESLARLGAKVTGADASPENIGAATQHASADHLLTDLKYQHTTAEELAQKGEKFDVVVGSEIIEHVADRLVFLQACADLVKVCMR